MNRIGADMAAVNDIYRVKVHSTHPTGQVTQLYFDYQVTSAGAADALDVLTAWQTALQGGWRSSMDEESDITFYQAINGMDNDDFEEQSVAFAGTRVGGPLPPAICALARNGRGAPGEVASHRRFPFGVHTDLGGTDGEWTTGFLTAFESFVDDLENALSPSGGDTLVPVQLTGGFVLGVTPVVNRQLTTLWQYAREPGWMETREPGYSWVTSA